MPRQENFREREPRRQRDEFSLEDNVVVGIAIGKTLPNDITQEFRRYVQFVEDERKKYAHEKIQYTPRQVAIINIAYALEHVYHQGREKGASESYLRRWAASWASVVPELRTHPQLKDLLGS